MSKAIRVRQGLIVRLIRRMSEVNRKKLKGYFGATDINQSRELWSGNPMVPIPDLALPSISDIYSLPTLDLPLIDPLTVVSNKSNQNVMDLISVSQVANSVSDNSSIINDTHSITKETVNVEDLVQALEITGAKVKEVRALPAGGSCIKIEDFFVDYTEPEYEYVTVGR